MEFIKLTPDALSVDEVNTLVTDPSCGAISIFVGTTRNTFEGQNVVRLEYESYQEMAEKEIRKLCKRAREKWSLHHIAVYHRLGLVPVSEASVILAVSSVHRRESLDAVSFLIDELKANVPIWKKEVYDDGSDQWKQNKECVWTKKDGNFDVNLKQEEDTRNTKRVLEDPLDISSEPLIKKIKTEPRASVESDGDELDTAGSIDENTMITKKDKPHTAGSIDENTMITKKDEPHTAGSIDENTMITKKEEPVENLEEYPVSDPHYVQIVASKNELSRRIKAFQQRKREELDVLNVQEFCTMSGSVTSLNSCARTAAVVLRSKDSNSHLKLTRVVNEWGPQTLGKDPGSISQSIVKQGGGSSSSDSSREGSVERASAAAKNIASIALCKTEPLDEVEKESLPPGLDERLHNLESHLKIVPSTPVPRDVYARLKAVEDRVLHLEGISPEYFGREKKMKIPETSYKKKEIKAVEDDLSLDELDNRIYDLKMKLKERQIKHAF